MPYTIYHADGSPVNIPDTAISATFYNGILPSSGGAGVGIGLVGQNAVSYGSITAQNFLQITENFANTSSPNPSTPIIGQTWFNTSLDQLNVRTSTGWVPLAYVSGAVVTSISGGTTGLTPASATSGVVTLGGTLNVANGGTGTNTFTAGYLKASGTTAFTTVSSIPSTDISGNIAGNAANVTGVVAIANGGTGQTTANTALNALLPAQSGQTGKFLTTNGTSTSWATVSGGGGGSVTSISITANQGVTGVSDGNATSPALTISLGDITPTSVTATSVTTFSNVQAGTGSNGRATLTAGGSSSAGSLTFGSPSGVVQGTIGVTLPLVGVTNTGNLSYVASTHQFTGDITATGNVTASASDSRLKTNLTRIGEAVAKVQQLTGYTYDWDQPVCQEAGFMFSEARQVGVIAQDVQSVLPEAVAPSPGNNEYLTVKYEKLVALLIEAIKEQADEIAAIKQLLGK